MLDGFTCTFAEGMWKDVWQFEDSSTTDDLLGLRVWPGGKALCVGRKGACLWRTETGWKPAGLTLGEDLYAVWGQTPDHCYAVGGALDVGGESKVCEYVQGRWHVHKSTIQSVLLDVSGNSEAVRAVGFNGGIVERVNGRFAEITAETNAHLFSIQARSAGRWVVGGLQGTLREWDGKTWTDHATTDSHVNGLSLLGPDGLLAVTHTGEILEMTSEGWNRSVPEAGVPHFGVDSTTTGSNAFACGGHGTIFRRRSAGHWTNEKTNTNQTLYAVGVSHDHAIAVGAAGVILMRAL